MPGGSSLSIAKPSLAGAIGSFVAQSQSPASATLDAVPRYAKCVLQSRSGTSVVSPGSSSPGWSVLYGFGQPARTTRNRRRRTRLRIALLVPGDGVNFDNHAHVT